MKKKVKNEIKEEKKFKLDKKSKILLIVFGLSFILLTVLVLTGVMRPIDDAITSYIIGIRNTKLTNKMINITNIGGAYSLIVISLLLLVLIKKRKIPLIIIINLVLVFITNRLFKFIIRRPRPDGLFLINESGFSYPSGHAMVSFVYIIFVIYLINKYFKNKILKIILDILLFGLALLIGFSRIYLGVHYFTDIIGGYLLGTCYFVLFTSYIDSKEYLK